MKNKIKDYDFTLIITPILLAAFGIVMIYSASMVTAVVDGLESTYYLYKQLLWFAISLVGFIVCCLIPYKYYQNFIKVIIVACVFLLIAVLLFGEEANNATRSLVLFNSINLQPSEFVKLGLIVYLAYIYSKKQAYINDFKRGVLPPIILTVFILGLIIRQPDLGTATIILLIASTIILSSGVRMRHIILLFTVSLIMAAILIPYMITDVRVSRFTGAYDPFTNPDSGGFHLIQSYLAIGASGLSGEGLGQSIQKLGYLWGAHTDFIMSVVAEELGVIGVIVVISMLAIIVLRGFFIARKCEDSFGALLAIGISAMIGLQTFINLGSISGILPITGVPLPFLSYGGSSLFVLMLSMGILNNIAKSVNQIDQKPMRINKQNIYKRNVYSNRGGRTWPI